MIFSNKTSVSGLFYYSVAVSLFLKILIFQAQAASNSFDENEESFAAHYSMNQNREICPCDLTYFKKGLITDRFRMIDELSISGSHQYTLAELEMIIREIPHNHIIFIDVREEPHLMFCSKTSASVQTAKANAYNGLTAKEIQQYEENLSEDFSEFRTEKDCVKSLGAQYLRIPVTDTTRPEDSDVDDLINFARSIEGKDCWLHFHCLAGLGRTTTFMSMYEMIKTASSGKTSLKNILARQHQIGGADLSFMWYCSSRVQWVDFLKNFYDYAKKGFDQGMSWSQWVSQRNLKVFQEQPSVTPWWSLKGLASYGKFTLMMASMRISQLYRMVRGHHVDDTNLGYLA